MSNCYILLLSDLEVPPESELLKYYIMVYFYRSFPNSMFSDIILGVEVSHGGVVTSGKAANATK